jgi:hypothetical protein
MKRGIKYVPDKSGLNQWLAGGRTRAPGEVYFPIPSEVHRLASAFFPARNQPFELELPSGQVTTGKVCQEGGKAIMTAPNFHLSTWLFLLIDGSLSGSVERYSKRIPYTYDDLIAIGFDSVRVEKSGLGFKLLPEGIGAYENWLQFRKRYLDL